MIFPVGRPNWKAHTGFSDTNRERCYLNLFTLRVYRVCCSATIHFRELTEKAFNLF